MRAVIRGRKIVSQGALSANAADQQIDTSRSCTVGFFDSLPGII